MNILYTSTRYYPVTGGSEISFMELINFLTKEHKIKSLILTQEWKNFEKKIERYDSFTYKDKHGNEVSRIPYLFDGTETLVNNIMDETRKNIVKAINGSKLDLIHSNFLNHFTYTMCKLSNEVLNLPFVVSVCGSDIFLFPEENTELKIMAQYTLEHSSHIVAKSNDIKEKIISDYGVDVGKVSVVTNGVREVGPLLTNKNIQIKKPYFLAIGALRWVKGYNYICDIAKELQQRNIDADIIIIGEGEDRKFIERFCLIHELTNVKLLGSLEHEETLIYLSQSICLINTSHYEGCPNTVLEAFACGKPVIAFDTYGLKSTVENQRNGFLVKQGDIKTFTDKMHQILTDVKLRTNMSSNAIYDAKNKYNWDKVSTKIVEIYQKYLR